MLVDGLDEAGPRGLDALNALRRRLGGQLHALVAGTRPPRPSLPGAIEAWLPRWNAEEVEEFLVRWEAHDAQAVGALRHPLHRPMLSALCASPLTATLCLIAARENPEALQSRASVYTEVIERLFDAWARERTPRTGGAGLTFKDVAPVLRRLALEVVRRERSTISATELRASLRREMPDAVVAAVDAVEIDLGVLIRFGDDYEFSIRGIAEHLAGRGLLERGDAAVAEASLEPWAEEVCRHAIGWAALTEPGEPWRALGILDLLLQKEAEDHIACTNTQLRSVLVATRAAADLGTAAAPVAEKLMDACTRRLLDETSLWVGDRVAEAVRDLIHTGAPCWAPLVKECFAWLCYRQRDRAAWFEAQSWDDPDQWAELLLERDPAVRRVAVDRLAQWVDDPRIRSLLTSEILDYGHGYGLGGAAPAIGAGLALRRAPRDETFTATRSLLVAKLQEGAQLTACAAAVALHPDEANPVELASALRHGAQAFPFPPEILEDLANNDEGQRALDRAWPDWKNYVTAREPQARAPLHPCSGYGVPPVSESVQARLVRAVAPALRSEDHVRRMLEVSYAAAPSALCELAYDDPTLVMPLLHPSPGERLCFLAPDAERALGRAALRHPTVRDELLQLWASIGPRSSLSDIHATMRQLYPGRALEPLIRRGDSEAAMAYAEWLPNAPNMVLPLADSAPLAPEILAVEPIGRAARDIVDRIFRQATEGRVVNETTGERTFLMSTTAGSILHCLWPVWQGDISLHAGLEAWLLDRDTNRFVAALHALEGLALPLATQDVVERGIRAQLEAHEFGAGTLEMFVLPQVLRFIHRTGLAARLEPLLVWLAESGATVSCYATAVLIPLRDDKQAEHLSQEAAEGPWPHRGVDMIDAPLFRRMVTLAPESWATALERAIEPSFAPLAAFLIPFVDALPSELRRRVLLAWFRHVEAVELPWAWDGSDMNQTARPADRIRQLLFDHGFERDVPRAIGGAGAEAAAVGANSGSPSKGR